MSDRDDDFRRLVPMLPGWTVSEPDGNLVKSPRAFRRADYASFGFPAPDAPLPEQVAFAARIAEELVPTVTIASRLIQQDFVEGVLRKCKADTDLAWAAVRAAIAAKGGAT